ncbi:MAG TPA: hypothetical protein VKE25_12620 [Actinomycetes bacterium]|nr:hypothetical protein [Actinomycetes bacterium]
MRSRTLLAGCATITAIVAVTAVVAQTSTATTTNPATSAGTDRPAPAADQAPGSGQMAAPSDAGKPLELANVQESVDYLKRTYLISTAEALRRLELQRISPALAERLKREFPDSYGGMWLDQDHGGVVVIAGTNTKAIGAALADQPDRAHIRVRQVRHSLRQLDAAAHRIAARLRIYSGGPVDVGVNPTTNGVDVLTRGKPSTALAVRIDRATAGETVPARLRPQKIMKTESKLGMIGAGSTTAPPAITAVTARLAAATRTATAPGTVARAAAAGPGTALIAYGNSWCAPLACDPPLRGGVRLDIQRDGNPAPGTPPYSWGGCTNGFNVRGSNGWVYTLTAGHCVLNENHDDAGWTDYSSHNGLQVGIEPGGSSSTRLSVLSDALALDYALMPYDTRGINWSAYWITNRIDWNRVAKFTGCWLDSQSTRPGFTCSYATQWMTGYYDKAAIGLNWVVCFAGTATDNYYWTGSSWAGSTGAPSGWVPGLRCGEVENLPTIGASWLLASVCTAKGDSGGPLFSQVDGKAYGILHDGPPATGNGVCAGPSQEFTYLSEIFKNARTRSGGVTFSVN